VGIQVPATTEPSSGINFAGKVTYNYSSLQLGIIGAF
jgi:hypothetical protein